MNSKTKNNSTNTIKNGQLDNGLQYIITNNPNSPSVAVLVKIRYGSAFDPVGKSGIAHLLEHLLFKGTIKRPQNKNVMLSLNSVGADYNAYTAKTFIGFHAKSAYMYLENTMDILSDLLLNPIFLHKKKEDFLKDFEKEKQIVLQELLAIRDQPSKLIHELIEKNMYNGGMGTNSEDNIKDIKKITLEDVIDVFRTYYCAQNMILSIHGNLGSDFDHVLQLITKYFSHFPKGIYNTVIMKEPKENPKLVDIFYRGKMAKCQIVLLYPHTGYLDTNVFYMLELFSLVFGKLTSGRLFQSVRENQGLIYSITSNSYYYDYLGYYYIQTNTNQENLENVLTRIKQEIERVQKDGLTKEELELAKNNYSGKLLLDAEDPLNIAEYNSDELFYHGDHFIPYFKVIDFIKSISLENINTFIRSFLSNPPIVTVIKTKSK